MPLVDKIAKGAHAMTPSLNFGRSASAAVAAIFVLLVPIVATTQESAVSQPPKPSECSNACRKYVASDESYCVCCQEGSIDHRQYWSVDPSTYQGWRTFETFCFVCHGKDGTGLEKCEVSEDRDDVPRNGQRKNCEEIVPNLIDKDPFWTYQDFRDRVAGPDSPPSDGEVGGSAEGEASSSNRLQMPAWRSYPLVSRHYKDLYVYLLARHKEHLPYQAHQRLRSIRLDLEQVKACGLAGAEQEAE